MLPPSAFSKIILLLIGIFPIMSQAKPVFLSFSLESNTVEQHGKFQANIALDAAYNNPFDYDQVRIYCTFTGPNNEQYEVDGFFMEDYLLNPNGALVSDGAGFKVRFSPAITGIWSYQVSAEDSNGETVRQPGTFEVVASTNDLAKGFVKTGTTNYLEWENGEQYIPIGENICWQNNNPYQDYKTWLDSLSNHGGNFFRLWHAHWGLGIEWKNNWNGFGGLLNYQQMNCRYQDWLFDYCQEKGIYVMLCLQHHGPVSTLVDPNWNNNPYNAANGGPCQTTADFFSNEEAKRITQNRYRYIVARWGYSQNIMSWELFNEVDWTDNYASIQQEVMIWHAEMASYLKEIDPYQHLVTTSFAREENDPLIWGNTEIDFTQTHHYIGAANLERVLAAGVQMYLDEYRKPTLTGEFGNGHSSSLAGIDPDGIHIHNGMWGSLMAGGLGTAMSWWWDIYIHPQDLYYHFSPIRKVADRIPFVEKSMSKGSASLSASAGDLDITPTGDWGVIGIDSVFISPEGTTVPSAPSLGIYLYGSHFNTDFRSPPVFTVDFPEAGEFTIHTASTKGTSPRIVVWVDGTKVLDKSADTNQSYSVSISAGPHTIKVDNTGLDWITISSYSFSGLGSTTDFYVLTSADGDVSAGWILNNEYHYLNVPQNGLPTPITDATLTITGMKDSSYFVKWFDCLTGAVIQNKLVTVDNGKVSMNVPPMIWDLAFVIDDIPEEVFATQDLTDFNINAYPNPGKRGQLVTITLPAIAAPKATIELLDMSGRQVMTTDRSRGRIYEVKIPEALASGMYWWRVRSGSLIGTEAVLITE